MSFFRILTPISYWLLIALWLFIFVFYINRLTKSKLDSKLITTLLVILAIDAFRTLFESVYFGLWYTSLIGFIPQSIHSLLTLPQYVFLPKAINLIAAILVIFILLRSWVPDEYAERQKEKRYLEKLEEEVKERQKIQKLLIESQAQLVEAQTIAKIGHYVLDVASETWTSSAALDEIFGIDSDFTKNLEGWRLIVHPDHREELTYYLDNQVLTKGQQFNKEYKIIHQHNQKELWVHGRGNLKFDTKGNVIEMFGTIQDITDTKLAERALYDQKRLMQIAIDNIPHFFFWKDTNLVYQGCNKNFAKAAGVDSPAEIVGKTDFDLGWKKEEAEFFRSCDRRVMQSMQPEYHIIEPQLQADGKQAWLDTNKVPMLDSENNLSGLLGSFEDITDRIESEKQLQDLAVKLKTAHQLGKSGWWEYDPVNDRFIWAEEAYQLYGLPSDMEIQYDDIMNVIDPDYRDYHNMQFEQLLNTGSADFMYQICRSDGDKRWIWGKGEAEYDKAGKPIRILGILQDVTKEKQAEYELNKAKNEAESANKAKSAFLSHMSHELRTPLNAILGYTQIFTGDESLSEKQQRGIRTIHTAGEHLLMIINDVLDMSKIEAGNLELVNSAISLESFLDDIVDFFKYRGKEKDIDITVEKAPELHGVIIGDELRLRQVLFNLLSNSIKFTQEGFCRLHINSERCEGKTCRITFSVEDTGVGIPLEQQKDIFKPFKQVGDRLRYQEGSGLGLAISRRLVNLMGGELTVESPVNPARQGAGGPGCRFSFSIETEHVENTSLAQRPYVLKESAITGYNHVGNRETPIVILIVDNKRSNRDVLRDLLEPLNFHTEEAEDGSIVINLCLKKRPDLILMDLRMPNVNGFSAMEQLKQHSEFRNIPVLAVTASPGATDTLETQCVTHGFRGLIQKPFIVQELLELIADQLPIELTYQREGTLHLDQSSIFEIPSDDYLEKLADFLAKGDIEGVVEHTKNIEKLENGKFKDYALMVRSLAEEFKFAELEKLMLPEKKRNA
jgi:PAS domain S-box-containing protein